MTLRPHLPSPAMVRTPVDAVGLASLWSACGVPRQTAVNWCRFLPADDGERVLALFDAMDAAPEGRAN